MPLWGKRKPEVASPLLAEVVQSQGIAIVELDARMKVLKHIVDELEDHVDKRFRSIRAMTGQAALRAAEADTPDGGSPAVTSPPPPPVIAPEVSTSKADLIRAIEARRAAG